MKTNWQTKQLDEVLEYEQPTKYLVASKNYKDEYETPVLTAGKSFILGKTKEQKGIFPAKDLPVIIFDDFTTATKFVDFPFKVKSSAMKILHPVKNISDAKFIFYVMQNINFDHTGIHKRYWISEYSQIEILLPLLPEQKRIVNILDEVFEKIEKAKENAEKNLQNSKELFESYLHDIFINPRDGWEIKKIGEVSKIEKIKKGKKDLPYVGMEDIESNSAKFIGSLNSRNVKSSSFYFSSEHILYGRLRPYLNKILIPDFEGHCSTEIFPIRVGQSLNKKLLFYWFLSNKTVKEINKTCTGTRMPRANMKEVFDFSITFPKSLSEQKAIIRKLDELSSQTKKLEVIYKQKLTDLEELKKSILKKAFSGEL